MKHKAYLIVLDFPIVTTGDIYGPEVVSNAILANKHKLNNRLFLGCFFDNKEDLDKIQKVDDLQHIDVNPALKLEVIQMKKNLLYYKFRSNNISHIIENMYIDGDNWVAEIETLPTGQGLKLEKYLLNNDNIKFRPVVAREREDGIITNITCIASIDAVRT